MKETRYLESAIVDSSPYKNTLEFRLKLFNMILLRSSRSITEEPISVFNAIYDILIDMIFTQRPLWKDFLIGAYAMGKKSFNCIEYLLDVETSMYFELEKAMTTYLEEEKKQIDKIRKSP